MANSWDAKPDPFVRKIMKIVCTDFSNIKLTLDSILRIESLHLFKTNQNGLKVYICVFL